MRLSRVARVGWRSVVVEHQPTQETDYTNIPRAKGLPLVGTLPKFLLNGSVKCIHKYSAKQHEELGGIYAERMGNVDAVFVADPGLVRHVFRSEGQYPRHLVPQNWLIYNEQHGLKRGLFFMDGEVWWTHRQVLNKLMSHPKAVAAQNQVFNQVSDALIESFKQKKDGIIPDFEPVLYQWSVTFLLAFLFGDKWNTFHLMSDQVEELTECVREVFTQSAAMTVIPPQLAASFNLQTWKKFVAAFERAMEITGSWVDNFMKTRSESGVIGQCLFAERLGEEVVKRIVIDLILAAADTTTFTTQWALYLLAKHEDIQEEVRREVLDVSTEPEQTPGLVKGAVRESMRLYPVAPFLTRLFPHDARIGPYLVPKDTLVLVSLYAMGRERSLFKDPLDFQPKRWQRNVKTGVTSFSFLPFGFGPRACVGRRLAEINMYLLISKMLENFKLSLNSSQEVEMMMRMVGVPEEKIGIKLSRLK